MHFIASKGSFEKFLAEELCNWRDLTRVYNSQETRR